MTDANKLAESLRTMRSSARRHHDGAGGKVRWSVVLDAQWIGDLSDAADVIARQAAELERMRALAEKLQAQKPVAWIRYQSDGGIQGPLLDAQIEDVRRAFWTPLIAAEWVNRDASQQKEVA